MIIFNCGMPGASDSLLSRCCERFQTPAGLLHSSQMFPMFHFLHLISYLFYSAARKQIFYGRINLCKFLILAHNFSTSSVPARWSVTRTIFLPPLTDERHRRQRLPASAKCRAFLGLNTVHFDVQHVCDHASPYGLFAASADFRSL